MASEIEDIALFDMDGTLCDYIHGLASGLQKIQSAGEPVVELPIKADAPAHVWQRVQMITGSPDWWANLPRFELGFDVWKTAEELQYRRMILTQGPSRNPFAWSGKKMWINKHLGETVDMTITRDKGLVYGKVLVDDYPAYIERWLKWRPRGLVIMPANDGNKGFAHPQVIRYDGTNLAEVRAAMVAAKQREPLMPLSLSAAANKSATEIGEKNSPDSLDDDSQVIGIHHVAIQTSSIEKAVAFYTEILGAKLLEKGKFKKREMAWLRIGDTKIELFSRREGEQLVPWNDAYSGPVHIAIQVKSLEEFLNLAMQKGAEFHPSHPGPFVPPVPGASKIACLLGPDGEEIEIRDAGSQR